jgi:hypothetical protein
MKRILVITILLAASSITLGATQTTASKAESQSVPNAPGQQSGNVRAAANSNHATHTGVVPKPNHPPVNPDQRIGATVGGKAQQSLQEKSNQIASTGGTPDKAVSSPRPRKVSALSRPSVSTPNDIRHHGSNAPSIGGPEFRHATNSGTISGNGIKRRP